MASKVYTYTRADGAVFKYGFVRTPAEMAGRLIPFRSHWWCQYLGDGTQEIFDTKAQCLEWIRSWDDITK